MESEEEEAPRKRPKRQIKRVKRDEYITEKVLQAPPSLQEHIENMFSNKIQAMHMVWILLANKRGIISDGEMDHLQFLPYNNQSAFFIITLFLVLYECLKCDDIEQAKMKWAEDGVILFHELLLLMERKIAA
jgi:hypothetical protein